MGCFPIQALSCILIEGAELAVLGFCSCRQKNPKNPKFHCGDNLFWIIFLKCKIDKKERKFFKEK
jgi:hypothetical protein